jgi:NADPH-dependent 2,4-dienoyl-CoA reductase/sulfur reductase-like enzyme
MGMPASIEVLIIGAGPSGLFAAVELARQGVRARVVEREPARTRRPVPPRYNRERWRFSPGRVWSTGCWQNRCTWGTPGSLTRGFAW